MKKHSFKVGLCALALLVVLTIASPGFAKDLWPVPWDPSLPNQTSQAWEATPNIPGAFEIPPTMLENPYGMPYLNLPINSQPEYIPGPDGMPVWTWHIGPGGGTVSIWIPNSPMPNYQKLLFWQMTSDKSPTPTGDPPTTNPPGQSIPSPYPQIQHQGTWYTYNGLIAIRPNPVGEWLNFNLVESTNIEEIVIKTVCMVPEPASLLALLGGIVGLGHMVIRRRR